MWLLIIICVFVFVLLLALCKAGALADEAMERIFKQAEGNHYVP